MSTVKNWGRIDQQRTAHDFGVTDAKGRAIGALVYRWVDVVIDGDKVWSNAGPDGKPQYLAPGVYYGWMGYATRAGETFGALQPRRHLTTEADRERAIADYVAGAAERATKTAGGGRTIAQAIAATQGDA